MRWKTETRGYRKEEGDRLAKETNGGGGEKSMKKEKRKKDQEIERRR